MDSFFARLQHVTQMHFIAESLAGSAMGWSGQGRATVTTERLCVNGVSILRMMEEGQFQLKTQNKSLPMMNAICLHLAR